MAKREMILQWGADHSPVTFCGVRDVDMSSEELIAAFRWAIGATRGPIDDEIEILTEEQIQDIEDHRRSDGDRFLNTGRPRESSLEQQDAADMQARV